MPEQVLTIHTDGSLSGLHGEGIDVKSLGTADVTRTSDIVWSHDMQKFYVYFIHLQHYLKDDDGNMLFFYEYNDAKKAEVAYLDALRLKGLIGKPE